MKKFWPFFLSICGLLVLFSGCSQWIDRGKSITAVGSSAMQPLIEAAGEEYSSQHTGEFVNVQGGGSGTGLSQLQERAVEIGNSDLFAEEKTGIDASKLVDHQVAVVGTTPVVHKNVGVKSVTLEQLQAIFTGEITNWQEIGGKDIDIVLVNRAAGSGSRHTFEQFVMQGKAAKKSQEQDSTGMVRQIVSSTPGAISYLSFSYVTKEIATLSIDGVAPTERNVQTNKWPIWSYEHMYTYGEPEGLTKEFIDFVLSPAVQQKLVPQLGYIPIHTMEVQRSVDGKIEVLDQKRTSE